MSMPPPRVPVTIVTGFLGSGKTTLLRHVLAQPGSERICVIVNEFGDIGLDHELLEASDDDVIRVKLTLLIIRAMYLVSVSVPHISLISLLCFFFNNKNPKG